MSDSKISALDPAAALGGAELVPLVQSGSTVRSTVSAISSAAMAAAAISNQGSNTGYGYLSSANPQNMVLSNGNRTFTNNSGSGRGGRSTFGRSSGKYYFEIRNDAGTSIQSFGVTSNLAGNYILTMGQVPGEWAIANTSTDGYYNGSSTAVTPVTNFTVAAGDVFSIAVDLDAGKFWAARNGVWFASGDPAAGTNAGLTTVAGTVYPASNNSGTGVAHTMRLELAEFSYVAPTGFLPWAGGYQFAGRADSAVKLSPWQIKSAAFTAVSGDRIMASTSGSAWTLTLPASPAIGDEVSIMDAAGTFGTNALTVGRNGATIAGAATNLTLSTNGTSISLVYTGTTWRQA